MQAVEACLKEFQSGTKTVSNLIKGHPCDILAKNLAVFCPCHENLSEAKFKSNGFTSSVEQIKDNITLYLWKIYRLERKRTL